MKRGIINKGLATLLAGATSFSGIGCPPQNNYIPNDFFRTTELHEQDLIDAGDEGKVLAEFDVEGGSPEITPKWVRDSKDTRDLPFGLVVKSTGLGNLDGNVITHYELRGTDNGNGYVHGDSFNFRLTADGGGAIVLAASNLKNFVGVGVWRDIDQQDFTISYHNGNSPEVIADRLSELEDIVGGGNMNDDNDNSNGDLNDNSNGDLNDNSNTELCFLPNPRSEIYCGADGTTLFKEYNVAERNDEGLCVEREIIEEIVCDYGCEMGGCLPRSSDDGGTTVIIQPSPPVIVNPTPPVVQPPVDPLPIACVDDSSCQAPSLLETFCQGGQVVESSRIYTCNVPNQPGNACVENIVNTTLDRPAGEVCLDGAYTAIGPLLQQTNVEIVDTNGVPVSPIHIADGTVASYSVSLGIHSALEPLVSNPTVDVRDTLYTGVDDCLYIPQESIGALTALEGTVNGRKFYEASFDIINESGCMQQEDVYVAAFFDIEGSNVSVTDSEFVNQN